MEGRSNSVFDTYLERDLLPAGGLSAAAQTSSGSVRFRNEVSRLREQWQSVPFPSRMMGVAVTVFSVVAILLGSMIDVERSESLPTYATQPEFLQRVSLVLERLVAEESVTNNFLRVANLDGSELLSARSATDESIEAALAYFAANPTNLRLDSTGSIAELTIESELQRPQLLEVRNRIYPTRLLDASLASRVYGLILGRLAQYYLRLAARLNSPTPASAAWRVAVASSATLHAMLRDKAALALLSLSSNADVGVRGAAATTLRNEHSAVEFLLSSVIGPALPYGEFTELALKKAAAEVQEVFVRLAAVPVSVTPRSAWTTSQSGWAQQVTDPLTDLAKDLAAAIAADRTSAPPEAVHKPAPAMLALTCILCSFVAIAAGYGLLHRLTDRRYAAEIHAAHVMREAIVRVTEYAFSFESFDLNPPPAPEGMMGTPTGEIELALSRCLAGLKALAPFLPAPLLPFRNPDALKQVEAVRQIERGQATLSRQDRTFVKTSSLQLYAPEDTESRPSHAVMKQLTDLQLRPTYVYCLTLDLSEVHRSVNTTKGSIEHVALVYPRIVEQFEEVVLTHGGVLSVMWMDQAIAVWNANQPNKETAVTVTHAASAVVTKLNALRRLTPDKLQSFRVHLGLTAGEVYVGVFGNDEFKTMQFFGAPIARGHQYATVNAFHTTAIACDESVKDDISHAFACKPIEILPAFGSAVDVAGQSSSADVSRRLRTAEQTVAYEVISGAGKKEDDLATRLAMYRRAFDLFAQGYYREALKAFRGYTKQYGYDRSVERIQAVMTGE